MPNEVTTELNALGTPEQRPQVIDLMRFIPAELRQEFHAAVRGTEIVRPPNAFQSDGWSAATVEGALKLRREMEGRTLSEVGVGAGTVSVILAALGRPERLHVSDYIADHVDLTRGNAARVLHETDQARFVFHEGSTNLVEWADGTENVDVLIACIPQVVKGKGEKRHPDDEANYIPDDVLTVLRRNGMTPAQHGERRAGTQEEFLRQVAPSDFDLDLNMALLDHSAERRVLSEKGYICLTLGGRPGEDVLLHLIRERGYVPDVVHRKLVAQDPHTNIESLVSHESELQKIWPGFTFDFFEDGRGTNRVGARRAAELLRAQLPVYHEVLIVRCVPGAGTNLSNAHATH